MTVRVWSSPKV